ncbi:hypothetical protein MMC22_004440 [Lobaria immixta]|nr:hypothetical protein [Lobaria immixta]
MPVPSQRSDAPNRSQRAHVATNAVSTASRPSQPSTSSVAKVTKTLQRPQRNDAPTEDHMPSPSASGRTTPSETMLLASPTLIESPSTQLHTTPGQDTLPNLLTSTDPTTASSSSLTPFSAELDDFFTSLGSFPGPETPPYDLLSQPSGVGSVSNTIDTNDAAALLLKENFAIANDVCFDMPILTDPHTPSNSQQSITSHLENVLGLWPEKSCYCLITALGFLKELAPSASKAYTQQCEQQTSVSDAERPFPTYQSVIAQNERILEAMDSILQCSCSYQDGYLFSVLSLVLFKILDWYAAAGRAAPTVSTTAACCDSYNKLHRQPPHNPRGDMQSLSRSSSSQIVAGSLCVDGEDSGRVAAQMVLSKLHRVQRLVNKLSARFKGHGTGGAKVAAAVPPNSTIDGINMLYDGKGTSFFSTTLFDQLEADLRRRLRAVSLVIVDLIRRV